MTSGLDEAAHVRALRDAVERMEIPRLREDALARIVSRRASGERIALQMLDTSVAEGGRRPWLVSSLAGVAALIIAAVVLRPDAGVQSEDLPNHAALAAIDSACASTPATTRDSAALRQLMISAFGVPAACGAEPAHDGPIAYDASQIRAGTFTYDSKAIV